VNHLRDGGVGNLVRRRAHRRLYRRHFSGREKADQIGGPIRVAQMSGQVATLGFVALFNLAAILSISIGLLNLLPVPILDGGHLVFYFFEACGENRCRNRRRNSDIGSVSC
jgi:RIP metalloprotease RseP